MPSRHLRLGNLLPGVARTAIDLAFGQYGALEATTVVPHPSAGGGGGGEAHLTFRDVSAAAAAHRSLNGAFIPSLTGVPCVTKPLSRCPPPLPSTTCRYAGPSAHTHMSSVYEMS